MARRQKQKFYRLNQSIQAKEVRVVDEKGKQIGVMAIDQALEEAQKRGVDLVEVAPQAKPPVCKLVDFKKFCYLEAKKRTQEKRKSKKTEIKGIRLTPFMAENDFEIRMKRAKEFLKQGNKLKITVHFKGRQMSKKEFGYKLIKRVIEKLKTDSKIEREPRFVGRQLEMILVPLK